MRIPLSFLLLLTLSTASQAQTPRIDRVVTAKAGVYERQGEVVSEIADPNSPSGTKTISNLKLVSATTTIPARLATSFGFAYTLVGQPNGAKVTVKEVSYFPPPGMRNSTTNQMQLSYERSETREIGHEHTTSWRFTEPGDLIAGNWRIEIWYGGKKMATQEFTTIVP